MTTEIQSQAMDIKQEIDTIWIILYWKQWTGKTLTAICLSLDWEKRIYSNFMIYKDGKQINKKLKDISDVNNIRFSYTPWVIIIDEAGINMSSRKSMSNTNEILNNLLFLVRKLNCSLIWISQRIESIDVNVRVLSELVLEMRKVRRKKNHPVFVWTKQKYIRGKLQFGQQYRIDAISILNAKKITYNTLEKSKMI